MKQDKFCISKTLIYVVLSFFLGMGILAGINYINNQKLGSKPKAAGNCAEKKCKNDLGISSAVENRSVYVKYVGGRERYKYYKDQNCKYEAVEGVVNYCRIDITSPDKCIDVSWLYPNCKRPVYKKGNIFYANSSCQGIIVGPSFNNASNPLDVGYCIEPYNVDIPLKYDCPQGQDIVYYYNTASRKYTTKVGNNMVTIDEYGISNYCKTVSIITGTPYPTNRVMQGLSQFRCSDLFANTPKTRFIYANMSEFIRSNGDLKRVSFYKDSWKAKDDTNKINYPEDYCRNGPNSTPTPIPGTH